MKAWHFTSNRLRDGRPLPADGVKLIHNGELEMCVSGLHASKRIVDALGYAPGPIICRVEIGGEIKHDTDKLVCRERAILWRIDGEDLLRKFARLCALDVVDKWDAPEVVVEYLKTGREDIKDAARTAAWAARDATGDAAWAATRAAGDAAWAAARAAGDIARADQNKRLTRMVNEAHRKQT